MDYKSLKTKGHFPDLRLAEVLGIALCFVFTAFAQTNYFEQTGGPKIGGLYVKTNRIAVNKQDQIFAATDSGMFRSDDSGDNWVRINNGITDSLKILSLAINSKGHIFISSVKGGIFSNVKTNVFRSTDNGENWQNITNNMNDTDQVFNIAINSYDTVFAGKYRSGNNGDTWKKITDFQVGGFYYEGITPRWNIATGPANEVIIGSWAETYRSIDAGDTWQKLSIVPNKWRIGPIIITKQDYVLALVCDTQKVTCYTGYPCIYDGSGMKDYIIRSQDNGSTWNSIFSFADPNGMFFGTSAEPLRESPSRDIYFIKGNGWDSVFINWNKINNYRMPTAVFPFDLAFNSNSRVFIAAGEFYSLSDSGGVYRSATTSNASNSPILLHYGSNKSCLLQVVSLSNNHELRIDFSLPTASYTTLCLYNAQGKKINTILSSFLQKGRHSFSKSIREIPSGVYFVRLNAVDKSINQRFTIIR